MPDFDGKSNYAIQRRLDLVSRGTRPGRKNLATQFHLIASFQNPAPQILHRFLLDPNPPFLRAIPELRKRGRRSLSTQGYEFRLQVMPGGTRNLRQDGFDGNSAQHGAGKTSE